MVGLAVTALLHRQYGDRAFDRVLERFSAMAGRRLSMDTDVYDSERRTGHRNRAIAHLLLNFDLVHEQAEAALEPRRGAQNCALRPIWKARGPPVPKTPPAVVSARPKEDERRKPGSDGSEMSRATP